MSYYEQMARCPHEYQLSADQEARLFTDPEFVRWYEQQAERKGDTMTTYKGGAM